MLFVLFIIIAQFNHLSERSSPKAIYLFSCADFVVGVWNIRITKRLCSFEKSFVKLVIWYGQRRRLVRTVKRKSIHSLWSCKFWWVNFLFNVAKLYKVVIDCYRMTLDWLEIFDWNSEVVRGTRVKNLNEELIGFVCVSEEQIQKVNDPLVYSLKRRLGV